MTFNRYWKVNFIKVLIKLCEINIILEQSNEIKNMIFSRDYLKAASLSNDKCISLWEANSF
jgi:hypothetical protein